LVKKRGQGKDNQPKLDGKSKAFAIRCLAQFDTLTETTNKIYQEFGIKVTVPAIYKLRNKYKATIQKVRDKFCENVLAIPIANRTWRLKQLNRIYKYAYSKDKVNEQTIRLQALRQAESEMGENFAKLADAVKGSGDTTINNFFNQLPGNDNDVIDDTMRVLGNIQRTRKISISGN